MRLAGTDVRDVTFASMRHSLGMVTQDGHLFHETILSNLRLARPEASDDEVWDAVRRARLEPLTRRYLKNAFRAVSGVQRTVATAISLRA